jgi:hypothetical protein
VVVQEVEAQVITLVSLTVVAVEEERVETTHLEHEQVAARVIT